jgi:hypothetical protein
MLKTYFFKSAPPTDVTNNVRKNGLILFFETAPESSVPVTRSRFEEDQVSGLLRAYRKKFRWEMVGLAFLEPGPRDRYRRFWGGLEEEERTVRREDAQDVFLQVCATHGSVPVTRSRFEEDQVSGLLRAYRKKFRWEMVGLAEIAEANPFRNLGSTTTPAKPTISHLNFLRYARSKPETWSSSNLDRVTGTDDSGAVSKKKSVRFAERVGLCYFCVAVSLGGMTQKFASTTHRHLKHEWAQRPHLLSLPFPT